MLRLRNSDARPGRFSISDRDLRHARLYAADLGEDVQVVYQSHSGGPQHASERDRAAIAYSAHPWLIVAIDRDGEIELTAYEAVTAAPLEVVVIPTRAPH